MVIVEWCGVVYCGVEWSGLLWSGVGCVVYREDWCVVHRAVWGGGGM